MSKKDWRELQAYRALGTPEEIKAKLEETQKAAQERPPGRWEKENNRPKSYLYRCTKCGKVAYWIGTKCGYMFCPHCGKKMEE